MQIHLFRKNDYSEIDPYWDFAHVDGECFDFADMRPIFFNTPIWGIESAEATLTLRFMHEFDLARMGKDPWPKDIQDHTQVLTPHEVIYYFTGTDPMSVNSYSKVPERRVQIRSPSTTFAIDTSKLAPGRYQLICDILDDEQHDRILTFVIVRRPFYTFHHPIEEISQDSIQADRVETSALPFSRIMSDAAVIFVNAIPDIINFAEIAIKAIPVLVRHEGALGSIEIAKSISDELRINSVKDRVKQLPKDPREHESIELEQSVTLHSWEIFRNGWTKTLTGRSYGDLERHAIICLTLHRKDGSPTITRWKAIRPDGPQLTAIQHWRRFEFTSWHAPYEHEMKPNTEVEWGSYRADFLVLLDAGFGLPFPFLKELPGQPNANGWYQ